MDEKLRILLCEDDENLGMLLREYLQAKGYSTELFPDGEAGYKAFLKNKYDLCVLDVMMPKKDGFTLAQEIRQANAQIPIIFLTAKTLKEDILEGFKIGADDYITKPFSPTELNARVDSLYRRIELMGNANKEISEEIRHGDFVLNVRRRTLSKNDRNIELTQVEFQIIEYLFTNPDTPLDRNDILTRVWGESYFGEEKIVDVNIRRLRMKIEDDPSQPKYLVTVWGMGYKWNTAE